MNWSFLREILTSNPEVDVEEKGVNHEKLLSEVKNLKINDFTEAKNKVERIYKDLNFHEKIITDLVIGQKLNSFKFEETKTVELPVTMKIPNWNKVKNRVCVGFNMKKVSKIIEINKETGDGEININNDEKDFYYFKKIFIRYYEDFYVLIERLNEESKEIYSYEEKKSIKNPSHEKFESSLLKLVSKTIRICNICNFLSYNEKESKKFIKSIRNFMSTDINDFNLEPFNFIIEKFEKLNVCFISEENYFIDVNTKKMFYENINILNGNIKHLFITIKNYFNDLKKNDVFELTYEYLKKNNCLVIKPYLDIFYSQDNVKQNDLITSEIFTTSSIILSSLDFIVHELPIENKKVFKKINIFIEDKPFNVIQFKHNQYMIKQKIKFKEIEALILNVGLFCNLINYEVNNITFIRLLLE
ncbi:hypothetical protein A0H76_4 [Hepatospora eriocheir]|uniref:Uncharacterized protein n=1 Tax=Hepatospora eriocheir TaxID=1081669 RepID=A0A1X0QLP8_9MICR|nr:hypothetical protein A0H76_4 [Hepatospora eriocheir]